MLNNWTGYFPIAFTVYEWTNTYAASFVYMYTVLPDAKLVVSQLCVTIVSSYVNRIRFLEFNGKLHVRSIRVPEKNVINLEKVRNWLHKIQYHRYCNVQFVSAACIDFDRQTRYDICIHAVVETSKDAIRNDSFAHCDWEEKQNPINNIQATTVSVHTYTDTQFWS